MPKPVSKKFIGRYEVIDTLGRGAMGTVYKVLIPQIAKVAAVKVLSPSPRLVATAGMDWLRAQFGREAQMMANLRHPHVADVWSLEEAGDRLFYLMEFFGRNLGVMIGETYWADAPSRVVPTGRAARWLDEVLQGLGRLHQAGIVHRDIKPFNIMLTDYDTVKITDLGLSRKRGETAGAPALGLIGTAHYAAPEQIAAPESVDPRADLFSAGVMLYRMLTGRLPGAPVALPSRLNPDLDGDWDAFLMRAMAPDPGARFEDAPRMTEALRDRDAADQAKRRHACAIAPASSSRREDAGTPPSIPLRDRPAGIIARRAATVFDLDALARPNRYNRNDLTPLGPEAVLDRTCGLIWQQAGSEYPMTWEAAQAYIAHLREIRFGGRAGWRLPTVNELLSLLDPPTSGTGFCLASPLSPVQQSIWSGDWRSPKAAWGVDVQLGFVFSSDRRNFSFAKGVCSR